MAESIWAKCPFYQEETCAQQLCHDECFNEARVSLKMKCASDIELYRDEYCYDNWQSCSIARVLLERYQGDEV